MSFPVAHNASEGPWVTQVAVETLASQSPPRRAAEVIRGNTQREKRTSEPETYLREMARVLGSKPGGQRGAGFQGLRESKARGHLGWRHLGRWLRGWDSGPTWQGRGPHLF